MASWILIFIRVKRMDEEPHQKQNLGAVDCRGSKFSHGGLWMLVTMEAIVSKQAARRFYRPVVAGSDHFDEDSAV